MASQENYQAIIDKGFYEIIDYKNLNEISEKYFGIVNSNINISNILNKVLEIFSDMQMNIYVKQLFSVQGTGIICVRSIVRELEIFNLITSELIVAPGKRGIKALQE